jgi:short-subunit dehydrogenase
LIARNSGRLEALVQELGPCVLGHRAADLDRVEDAARLVGDAFVALGGVDVALIAHGYLGDQLGSEHELAEAVQILQTNLVSPVALLIALANRMEEAGAGHLGVITSVAGERGRPRNFTYGAAKGGLTRYLEGLRSRLYASGVTVHNFKLGPVDSPMTVNHHKTALFSSPEKVAVLIERAFSGSRHEVYVPGFWRWIMMIVRRVPEPIFQRAKFLSGR